MNIDLVSDLHLEFTENINLEPQSDYLFMCGDILPIRDFRKEKYWYTFDTFIPKYQKVFYIFGNHEYYRSRLYNDANYYYIQKLKNIYPNLEILDCSSSLLDINNEISIFGGTLWTKNDELESECNDFQQIKRFGIYDRNTEYEKYISKLEKFLSDEQNQKCIILSHHAPLPMSKVDDEHIEFYCNDLRHILERYSEKIHVWCHGHTHKFNDYMYGKTRIVCNPRGYGGYDQTFENYKIFSLDV